MEKRFEVIALSFTSILVCLCCSITTLSMTWDRTSSNCQEFCLILGGLTPLLMSTIGLGLGLVIVIRNSNFVVFSQRPWMISVIFCFFLGALFLFMSYLIIMVPYLYDFFDDAFLG